MEIIKENKLQCIKHGGFINAEDNFYLASEDSIFSGVKKIAICKNCLKDMVNTYYIKTKDIHKTIYLTCRKIDLSYVSEAVDSVYEDGNDPVQVFQKYITYLNSTGKRNGINNNFDLGEHILDTPEQNDINGDNSNTGKTLKLTEDELRIKKEVIELIEYDPFKDYTIKDQKFLYSDLIGYLSDEEVLEDTFLISQLIQIVINNLQINEINSAINKHMAKAEGLVGVEGEIDKLNNAKEKISRVNNNIAKENNLTVKSRGGSTGKSSITQLITRLKKLDFKEIEEDYFSQELADSMQRVANMSMKAIAEQMKFDENDTMEMIVEQRRMITEKDKEILHLKEELRSLYAERLADNNE